MQGRWRPRLPGHRSHCAAVATGVRPAGPRPAAPLRRSEGRCRQCGSMDTLSSVLRGPPLTRPHSSRSDLVTGPRCADGDCVQARFLSAVPCAGGSPGTRCALGPQDVALRPQASGSGAFPRARVFPQGPCLWRRPRSPPSGVTPGRGVCGVNRRTLGQPEGQRRVAGAGVQAGGPDRCSGPRPQGAVPATSVSSTACLSLPFKAC